MSMPKQKPGKSKQDYGTPPELLAAVKNRLKISGFALDIAATPGVNSVAPLCFCECHLDALAPEQSWGRNGWSWLNPPYADIEPWVRKALDESEKGAHIAMLVPASVGSNWWYNWVEPYAYINYLNGRLTFVGEKAPYPKDCALLLYTPWGCRGSETWSWRAHVPQLQQPELGED